MFWLWRWRKSQKTLNMFYHWLAFNLFNKISIFIISRSENSPLFKLFFLAIDSHIKKLLIFQILAFRYFLLFFNLISPGNPNELLIRGSAWIKMFVLKALCSIYEIEFLLLKLADYQSSIFFEYWEHKWLVLAIGNDFIG